MAVIAMAGGTCAFPECGKQYYDEARNLVLGEVAHMKARRPGGARYDVTQTAAERNGVANLMLLCLEHSAEVDNDPATYTVETLMRMRAEHDAGAPDARPEWLARVGDSLRGIDQSTARVASATEQMADALRAAHRPRLHVVPAGGRLRADACEPVFELEQLGGDRVIHYRYRFFGSRVRPEDAGASLRDGRIDDRGWGRSYGHLTGLFDLRREPDGDGDGLGTDELGIEVFVPGDGPDGGRSIRFRVPFDCVDGKVNFGAPSPM